MDLKRKTLYVKSIVFFVFCFGLIVGAGADSSLLKKWTPSDLAYYLSTNEQELIRPGLKVEILGVKIKKNTPKVTFKITDSSGNPLDREGKSTPGTVNVNFVLSYIKSGESQYTAYTTHTVTGTNGQTATQPFQDLGGTYISKGDGVYEYVFKTQLPKGYDKSATTTLGTIASRDLTSLGLSLYVDNPTFDFRPDKEPVVFFRHVVALESCNSCHNSLSYHDGFVKRTEMCILCHQTQNSDPSSGNTLDFKVLIHKLHSGANLPSVKAGKPYFFVDNGKNVDFSDVVFPQDLRNCTKCHQNTTQAFYYKSKPGRAVCSSCHDDVNFETGEKHLGGIQTSDANCSQCHQPDSGKEFDASIVGSHTVPINSKQLPGVVFEIQNVTNLVPGQSPTVTYTIKNKKGDPILPTSMNSLSLVLGWPTSDVGTFLRESANKASKINGNTYTYTFTGKLPNDATGSLIVSVEGYVSVKINPNTPKEATVRDAGFNQVTYYGINGTEPVPRRQVVELSKCNNCHDTLALHGGSRRNVQYCIVCHNANNDDSARRPANLNPPESIHFKRMIHRIHTGVNLTQPFSIVGFNQQPVSFNEVRFPGDRRDCETCHFTGTYTLPMKGTNFLPTKTARDFMPVTQPIASACLGCHDSKAAASHASNNTSFFGESCEVCHGEGAEFAVTKIHAR
jgi:OmcA/MtrC family decaheme c-type cytochrome